MAFFSPATTGFEPKRKFRFVIDFSSFSGGLSIMATKCGKPSYEMTSPTEHRVLNHTFKFPGVIKWNDIDVSFIDAMQPNIATKFWNALQNSGFVVPGDATALTTGITKQSAYMSLGEVSIKQLNGGGIDVPIGLGDGPQGFIQQTKYFEEWILKNAFIKSVKWGDLDYSSDDLVNIDVGIVYDYAVLKSYDPGAGLQPLGAD